MDVITSYKQDGITPRQRVPKSVKETKKWQESSVRHFIKLSKLNGFTSADGRDFSKLYDAYNGKIDASYYTHVLNPYNSEQWNKMKFPARLRDYPIIRPIIDALISERAGRPFVPQVFSKKASVIERIKEIKQKKYAAEMDQAVINGLGRVGVNIGEQRTLKTPTEIESSSKQDLYDKESRDAQDMLEYAIRETEWEQQTQIGFFDFVVPGECYSFRDFSEGKVTYKFISPQYVSYDASDGAIFVEDGAFATCKMKLLVNDAIDLLGDSLKDWQIKEMEQEEYNSASGINVYDYAHVGQTQSNSSMATVDIVHVNWKSYRKVGKLISIGPDGVPSEIEVDEDYIASENEYIDWRWEKIYYHGYEVMGKWIVGVEPLYGHRKLCYNGRKMSNRHSKNVSLVELGIPFQVLYNIVHYRLELTLAKNKDKIVLMEIGAIPKKPGWDEDKFMYMADSMGFAFIDTTQDEKLSRMNNYQVLDASLGQHIDLQFRILQAIKEEWHELVGFTRQRLGQTQTSEAVSNVRESIFRSSIVTENMFRKFDDLEMRDVNYILNLTASAWREGMQTSFVDRNGELRTIDMETGPDPDFIEVYASNKSEDISKMQKLEALVQQFAQNKMDPLMIAQLLDSKSFNKIKQMLVEEREMRTRMEQEQQKAAQEAQAQKDKADFEKTKYDADRIDAREQMKQQAETERTIIMVTGNAANKETPVTPMEIANMQMDMESSEREGGQKDRELDLKEKEMDLKDNMNRRDNETALKNKVVGESKKKGS